MAVTIKDTVMASKFRGCMLGALMGDCFGEPFEEKPRAEKRVLQNFFDKLYGPPFDAPVLVYTDDTAMTISVAESLLYQNRFDATDMARRFVKEYFAHPIRGRLSYGAAIPDVFRKLQHRNFADVYAPAQEQFDGMGSYGNGGAMRVSPVALYYHGHCQSEMCNVARLTTKITHAHKDGYNGAILQCLAVDQCLRLNPKEPVDCNAFLNDLSTKLFNVQKDEEGLGRETDGYQKALNVTKAMLKESQVSDDKVKESLNNDVTALGSVPTAIFSFLRAQQQTELPGIQTDDPIRRTLQYAISLGGDTDTIATMAGALAGAYVGCENIPASVLEHCEAAKKNSELGDKLYEANKISLNG